MSLSVSASLRFRAKHTFGAVVTYSMVSHRALLAHGWWASPPSMSQQSAMPKPEFVLNPWALVHF